MRIAAALIHCPDVLFLDEPTSGLDVQSSRLIRSLVRELNKQGMTIFLTTHYIDEADQLCDRVTIIKQGKIVAEGSPERLKSSLQGDYVVEIAFDRNRLRRGNTSSKRPSCQRGSKQGDKYHIRTTNPNTVIKKMVQFATSNRLGDNQHEY